MSDNASIADIPFYTRHTSSRMCVGRAQSPESLTTVSSSGLSPLPPSCNSNYLDYIGMPLFAVSGNSMAQ
ncbi:hypothetical protein DVP00_10960 [Yersinia enterocolitica]|nr:hypothetical protein [Yersinia enterocolitica]EKN4923465.1 hypothetical protein [Yersinia enterocolitica]EKN4935450.1 hypothetical protein [Yersinia enterocolitica]EKN5023634.1 hypothetical protein [Yersinia enterocolitica]EKN5030345.1 hypothetical protein [Yersinia enterocolitica]